MFVFYVTSRKQIFFKSSLFPAIFCKYAKPEIYYKILSELNYFVCLVNAVHINLHFSIAGTDVC